jgi:hypothetical protein
MNDVIQPGQYNFQVRYNLFGGRKERIVVLMSNGDNIMKNYTQSFQ